MYLARLASPFASSSKSLPAPYREVKHLLHYALASVATLVIMNGLPHDLLGCRKSIKYELFAIIAKRNHAV